MNIKLTDAEIEMFERLSKNKALVGFLDKWIASLKDFTNIEDLTNPGEALKIRKELINQIDTVLVSPLKRFAEGINRNRDEQFM